MESQAERPFRLSLRWRITLPFLLLALAFALGGAFLVLRLLSETGEERFLRQLANSGQLAADAVVRLETELLGLERLVANTDGVSDAVLAKDAERLRQYVLPLVVNAGADSVAILDDQAESMLSIRRLSGEGASASYETIRGERYYADWQFVQEILQGDSGTEAPEKQVGLGVYPRGGEQFQVLYVGGPIQLPTGRRIGAVLVGEYLEDAAQRMGQASGANISVYGLGLGNLLASSIEDESGRDLQLPEEWQEASLADGEATPVRQIAIASVPYREALTPFEAKGGSVLLGITGASLIDAPLITSMGEEEGGSSQTTQMVVGLGALGLLLIGLAGLVVSHTITQPLVEIADATARVATGNLDVEIPERGGGEVTVVARSFNQMVRSLRQMSSAGDWGTTASLPPALLGSFEIDTEAVSQTEPVEAVLLALHLGLEAGSPESELEQAKIRAEEVFLEAETVIHDHRGQVLEFDGEAMLAAFSLPGMRTPLHVGALLATHAAFQVIENLGQLDLIWRSEGRPGLDLAAAVHEGQLLLLEVGKKDGLSPAAVGSTVKLGRGLLSPGRKLDRGGILVSERVYERLSSAHGQFSFGRSGMATVADTGDPIRVYEVKDRKFKLVEADGGW